MDVTVNEDGTFLMFRDGVVPTSDRKSTRGLMDVGFSVKHILNIVSLCYLYNGT